MRELRQFCETDAAHQCLPQVRTNQNGPDHGSYDEDAANRDLLLLQFFEGKSQAECQGKGDVSSR